MLGIRKSKIKLSSRGQIDILGVRDGILKLTDERYRAVLEVTPVNFELKSEAEQDAIIETFESYLNSIGIPMQILVRVREVDISKYLEDLRERLSGETVPIFQKQLESYGNFIKGLVTNNKILTRQFCVIVPFVGKSKVDFSFVKEQIGLSIDIVSKGLNRIGMKSRELTSLEVLNLFYSFYNPAQAKLQPLANQAMWLLGDQYISKEDENAES
jgi:hypothetical protein